MNFRVIFSIILTVIVPFVSFAIRNGDFSEWNAYWNSYYTGSGSVTFYGPPYPDPYVRILALNGTAGIWQEETGFAAGETWRAKFVIKSVSAGLNAIITIGWTDISGDFGIYYKEIKSPGTYYVDCNNYNYRYLTVQADASFIVTAIVEVDEIATIQIEPVNFEGDSNGWTFSPMAINSYDTNCAGASSTYDGHRIGITADNVTNRFGCWGPSLPNTIPYEPNKLYKFSWSIATNQSNPTLVPVFRLRINEYNSFSYSLEMVQTSATGTNSPPTAGTKVYNQYLLPLYSGDLTPAFDVYDFDENEFGTVYLEELVVTKYTIPATGWTTIATPSFANWTLVNGPGVYNDFVTASQSASSLRLGSTTTESRGYAFWYSPPINWTSGKIYRALFNINSGSGANTVLGGVYAGSVDFNWALRLKFYGPTVPDLDGNIYPLYFETATGSQFTLMFEGMDFEDYRGGINELTQVTIEEHNPF